MRYKKLDLGTQYFSTEVDSSLLFSLYVKNVNR